MKSISREGFIIPKPQAHLSRKLRPETPTPTAQVPDSQQGSGAFGGHVASEQSEGGGQGGYSRIRSS